MGSNPSVFKMSMSSVPCTSPLGFSAMNRAPLDCPEDCDILTLDCQEEEPRCAPIDPSRIHSEVRFADGKRNQESWRHLCYARFASPGSGGSAAWFRTDTSR